MKKGCIIEESGSNIDFKIDAVMNVATSGGFLKQLPFKEINWNKNQNTCIGKPAYILKRLRKQHNQ